MLPWTEWNGGREFILKSRLCLGFTRNFGADPNKAMRESNGEVVTPLYLAAGFGSTEVCRRLLASGARLDIDKGGELG